MHCNVAICPLLPREKSWVDHVFKCWAVEARQIEFSAAIWREGTFIKTHLHCGIREGAIGGICLAGNKACWAATIVACYTCRVLQRNTVLGHCNCGVLQICGALQLAVQAVPIWKMQRCSSLTQAVVKSQLRASKMLVQLKHNHSAVRKQKQ